MFVGGPNQRNDYHVESGEEVMSRIIELIKMNDTQLDLSRFAFKRHRDLRSLIINLLNLETQLNSSHIQMASMICVSLDLHCLWMRRALQATLFKGLR